MDNDKKEFKISLKTQIIVTLVANAIVGVVGYVSGSFATVWLFCKAHPKEAMIWCVLVFVIGFSIGLFARIVMMKRKGITAEQIAELESDKGRLEAENKELSDRLNPTIQKERKEAEREERIRKKIARLTSEEKQALYLAFSNFGYKEAQSERIQEYYQHLSDMGLIEKTYQQGSSYGHYVWCIDVYVYTLLKKDDDLRESLYQ